MILWQIFLAFFRIGSFSIGGAYSFLPLIEKDVVEKYHWLTKEEFLDVLGGSNIFPGAISIKFATYTGYKIAGLVGAFIANLGNLLTPALLVIFASTFYSRYKHLPSVKGASSMVEWAMFAMLIAVAFKLVNFSNFLHFRTILVVVISLVLFTSTKIHPAIIILVAGLIGAVLPK